MISYRLKIFIVSVVCSATAALAISIPAYAADARSYNAGRIIDDAIFTNSDSMTVQQIQQFLNSKVASCDTWGQKKSELGGGTRAQWLAARGVSTPITCLRDYYENPSTGLNNYGKAIPQGAVSAAQIIYNYSRQFGINPQVILVTLQKENGLVTDEWPTPKQYSEAMGFGCPDNVAPGAPACNPSYGSFSAQIYQAARHFRGYIDNPAGWWVPFNTGSNAIRWSPNAACGSGVVNIENRSTVALYSYTPYQPNQAAKNAQYGTGDGCSAYGNRNFYLYFTDWFGTTIGVQDLLSDGNGIYYVSNGYKYYVPSMQEFYNYGYRDSDVPRIIRLSSAELNKIPSASGFSQISVVVASAQQGIFVISNGYKYYVPSMGLLYDYGFRDADIMLVSEESINRYKTSSKSLSNFASDINGYAYRISTGERRVLYQPWVLNEYSDAAAANELSWPVLEKVKIGTPITKGRLVFYAGSTSYITINGKWFTLKSQNLATCFGSEGSIPIEPYRVTAGVSQGLIESCFVSDEHNNKFLLDGSIKYAITDNSEIRYSSVTDIADTSTISPEQHKNIFATNNGIYKIENGTTRHIMQMAYVNQELGPNEVRLLKTDSLKQLSVGANIYTNGTVISSPGRGINLVMNDKVYYVSTMEQFGAYGLNLANIVATSDNDIDKQAYGGVLPGMRVKCGGNYYIISGGTRYMISSLSSGVYGVEAEYTNIDCTLISGLRQEVMGRFITSPGNQNIYYLDNGKRRHILAWQTFLSLGGSASNVITLNPSVFETFALGSPL